MENKINNKQSNKEVEAEEMKGVGELSNNENLKSKILELIERDKIKPTSKIYFSVRDKALWSLLLISMIFGSIACSVMIFSFTNSEAGFYDMTNDSFLDFMLNMTPYLWVILFVVFGLIGYENFKHTNKGYRYSFSLIVVVGLVINIGLGAILHSLGVSKIIEHDFSSDNSFVRSSDSLRRASWNQPDKGIISGQVVSFSDGGSTFILKDFNGNLWTVSSMYIPNVSWDLISTSSEIRVIGVRQDVYFPLISTSTVLGVKPAGLIPSGLATSSGIILNGEASTTPYIGSVVACYILPWNTDDYVSGISKIKGALVNPNDSERNLSDKRNNNCRAIKSYNIIRSMVELK
jgi:hypothetical protein